GGLPRDPARRARRCGGQLHHPAPVFRPQLCHAGAGKRPAGLPGLHPGGQLGLCGLAAHPRPGHPAGGPPARNPYRDAAGRHIRAQYILPLHNLLENMTWTQLEDKSGVNDLNETTMGLLLLNLSLFAPDINRSGPDRHDENTVFAVLQYIEAHYKDGTLADAAARLHQPAYAVSRLLTKHTGQNFRQLLQQRKLQQAAYLLTHTPLPVETVLENIGYENSSYFYRRFRERYGCSPA